jgi:4-hydroxy-2-oxoheptanedioate aldolase
MYLYNLSRGEKMRTNRVKENLRAGKPSFGVGTLWSSPEVVEFCGYHGFDWLWIDLEHGAIDLHDLAHMVRAADASGMVAIGRLPQTRDPEVVLRYMETGLGGIITSHTHCKEDIEFAVRAIKYPPVGIRSAGVMRPANWGVGWPSAEYYAWANENTIVMALVEDQEGIENLDEILSVDGLDAVVIGYGDLSLTTGHPGNRYHPEVADLGKLGTQKVLASGVALQVTVQDGEGARKAVEDGALMIRCSIPSVLGAAVETWLDKARC